MEKEEGETKIVKRGWDILGKGTSALRKGGAMIPL